MSICLTLVFLVLAPVYSAPAATRIIVVTDDPANEEGLEPFLKEILGNDIAVEIEDAKYRDALSAGAKADLSSADLIIVSRQRPSSCTAPTFPETAGGDGSRATSTMRTR
jgi:hypothetical protein